MLKKMLQDQWAIASTSISLMLVLIIFGLLAFNIKISDQLYILHYKAIVGIDRIRSLSYFLLFTNPILEIIIIIATISIVNINR